MKSLIPLLALLAGFAPSADADFDAGVAAYLRKDYAAAVREFKPLAEKGDARAQTNLGGMYYKGHGVRQDYREAARWWREAAERGYGFAQGKLGLMYEYGKGVTKDYVQAHMWYTLAATQDHESAPFARDKIAKKMSAAQIVEAQKLVDEWKPKQ